MRTTRCMSVTSTVTGARSRPSPTSSTNCSSIPSGKKHELPVEVDPADDQVVEHEADEHRQRQHELDALGDDAPDHPDLARQVGRPDQPRLLDQALGVSLTDAVNHCQASRPESR